MKESKAGRRNAWRESRLGQAPARPGVAGLNRSEKRAGGGRNGMGVVSWRLAMHRADDGGSRARGVAIAAAPTARLWGAVLSTSSDMANHDSSTAPILALTDRRRSRQSFFCPWMPAEVRGAIATPDTTADCRAEAIIEKTRFFSRISHHVYAAAANAEMRRIAVLKRWLLHPNLQVAGAVELRAWQKRPEKVLKLRATPSGAQRRSKAEFTLSPCSLHCASAWCSPVCARHTYARCK